MKLFKMSIYSLIIYFGMSAISVNALAIDGMINFKPRWMSDGPYEDAEHLRLNIDDRVFHKKTGTGHIFGFLNFSENGSFAFVRDSSEFNVGDIDSELIQIIQRLVVNSESHQWIIDTSIPVVLFDHRNPNNKPLIVTDPMSLFVNRGCLRSGCWFKCNKFMMIFFLVLLMVLKNLIVKGKYVLIMMWKLIMLKVIGHLVFLL